MTLSKQQITIRKASSSDAEGVAKMGAHVFTFAFGHSVSPEDLQAYLDETYTTEAISRAIANPDSKMLVAADEEDVLKGFVTLERGTSEPCVEGVESRVELNRLYVDVEAHGQGVGTLLSNAIEQVAKEEGFRNMWLGVWEENEKAIRAYERWGYKMVGDHDFQIGDIVQRDLIMLKAL